MTNEFGQWLNEEIEERGWTGGEFSLRIGMSGAQVSRVLRGKNKPGIDKFLVATAKTLGLPLEEVLRRAGILPPLPPVDKSVGLAKRILTLDPRDREAVLDLWEIAVELAESHQRRTWRTPRPADD